mgnify:FL=1
MSFEHERLSICFNASVPLAGEEILESKQPKKNLEDLSISSLPLCRYVSHNAFMRCFKIMSRWRHRLARLFSPNFGS